MFCWAHFRKTKAGIKLHTLFDTNTKIPLFVHTTKANIHDVNAMDVIGCEPLAYYIFDRTYVGYKRLYRITGAKAYFVVRAKWLFAQCLFGPYFVLLIVKLKPKYDRLPPKQ
ncbi:MAG: transposase, partial [Marinirhabdus sp.]